MFLFGAIGFIDDYLIICKHNNDGIKPTVKFICQLIISVIIYFSYLSVFKTNELNFFGIMIDLKFIYGIFIIFIFIYIIYYINSFCQYKFFTKSSLKLLTK